MGIAGTNVTLEQAMAAVREHRNGKDNMHKHKVEYEFTVFNPGSVRLDDVKVDGKSQLAERVKQLEAALGSLTRTIIDSPSIMSALRDVVEYHVQESCACPLCKILRREQLI